MIRVPFSSASEVRPDFNSGRPPLRSDGSPLSETERVQMIEARLSTLEVKLVSHAEELKIQISERVMRIQSRVENAMRPFRTGSEGEEMPESASNVVEFSIDSAQLHHRHATNACEALNDLNEMLRLTREHLEALAGSVDRMRKSVAKP